MVGRPQAEIEDQVEIASTGRRIPERTGRAAVEQEIESVPAVFGISRAIVRNAVRKGAVHVFLRA
jgi:hypothetical protein